MKIHREARVTEFKKRLDAEQVLVGHITLEVDVGPTGSLKIPLSIEEITELVPEMVDGDRERWAKVTIEIY